MSGTKLMGVIGSALVLGVLGFAGLTGTGSASQSPPGEVVLEVRFDGEAGLRGSGESLKASSSGALENIEQLLARIGATSTEPLVNGISQAEASRIAVEARESSGSWSPNMANWYRVSVPAPLAAAGLDALRASPLVTFASRAPEQVPPPVTPDFSPQQLHLDLAPTGIGAEYSLGDPRTRGAGVTIVDLEYYWTREHEDLQLPASSDIGTPDFVQYTNFGDEHGTAVFGIMGALDNGFGVTGGVPEATLRGISPVESGGGYNPSGALTFLADKLDPGDVVLIEQQAPGPAGGSAYVPLEWEQSSFDAIKQLSNLGVVVVETGGNGGEDLDDSDMLGRFNRGIRDSDAIIVGAGDSATREPLWFTSRGSRVDLQGHGNNIVTTGGSHSFLQGGGVGQQNIRYTSDFGGTSGAGPIVASAVAAVLSYLKAEGLPPLEADDIVGLLRSTGTPQSSPESGQIGPLPDIEAAIGELDASLPTVSINEPADGATFAFNSSRQLDLSCSPGAGPELESCVAVDEGPNGNLDLVQGDQLPTDQPGSHTITATVTNQLGLSATDTVTYQVGPGCLALDITLAAVQPRGRNVRLLGVADPSRSGSVVTVQRNGKRAGSAQVKPDGSITATVAAPASVKARPKARYRLVAGRISSGQMKPNGGIRILSRKALPAADLVKAKLSGVRKKGRLTVRTTPLCGGPSTSRQVSHDRKGVFKVSLGFGSASRTYTVIKAGRKVPLPLVLPAARFALSG